MTYASKATYGTNSLSECMPTDTDAANGYGMYDDMVGNVYEWGSDW